MSNLNLFSTFQNWYFTTQLYWDMSELVAINNLIFESEKVVSALWYTKIFGKVYLVFSFLITLI